MPFAKNKAIVLDDKVTGAKMELDETIIKHDPEIIVKPVTNQFFNSSVAKSESGAFTVLHDRKVDANETDKVNQDGLSGADEETARDKEKISFDGYGYKKIKYQKQIDSATEEGKEKISADLASLIASKDERKAESFDTSYVKALQNLHTMSAGAATPKNATFSDGGTIKGKDGTAYKMPVLIKKSTFANVEAIDEAGADKLIEGIFKEIDEIRKTGKRSNAKTKNWPYARGFKKQLVVRCSDLLALALRKSTIYKGNTQKEALGLIKNGLSMVINKTAFVVDDDISENFVYQILPLGIHSPIYAPDRFKFTSILKDHPDFPNDFNRLTVSYSFGTAASMKNMHYTRAQVWSGVDLTTL